MSPLMVTVGSLSPHKEIATIQAFNKANLPSKVTAVAVDSGQNKQPLGFEDTLRGACRRAIEARRYSPEGIVVGIESGVILFNPTIIIDFACVVITDQQGYSITTTSQGLCIPPDFYFKAQAHGFEMNTVGEEVARELGGDPGDPHLTLTKGLVSRTDTLRDAIYLAIVQLPR